MFRSIDDFELSWAYESDATLKMLRALTDVSLAQRVTPAGRTLGRLAWHITQTLAEMGGHAGLQVDGPGPEAPVPQAEEIASAYEQAARSLVAAVRRQWTDSMLFEKIPMYGEHWTRGATLLALLAHQIHHRGQMTVLMRQAGLPVPGVYGPAREEWAELGMEPQA